MTTLITGVTDGLGAAILENLLGRPQTDLVTAIKELL